jgi:hypothetical protein
MNERIKELWDKAAKLESDPSWEGQTKFMEKFAELIVLESIEYCGENLSKTVGGALKIHFGVKQ